jgi:hypothetical protein
MITNELLYFLRNDIKTHQWFYFKEYHLNIYIRITNRYINGKFVNIIDLSTIEIEESFRNKGYFTKFLIYVELIATEYNRLIYVESILNSILMDFLLNRGYLVANMDTYSLYKPMAFTNR